MLFIVLADPELNIITILCSHISPSIGYHMYFLIHILPSIQKYLPSRATLHLTVTSMSLALTISRQTLTKKFCYQGKKLLPNLGRNIQLGRKLSLQISRETWNYWYPQLYVFTTCSRDSLYTIDDIACQQYRVIADPAVSVLLRHSPANQPKTRPRTQ